MAKKRKTELDIDTGAIPAPEAPPDTGSTPIPLEQEMARDAASARAAGAPFNKNTLIVFGIIIAMMLATIGIAAVALHKKTSGVSAKKAGGHGAKAKDAEKHKAAEPKFEALNNLVLDPFVIPYKDKGQDGFIRVVFALQVNDPEVIDEINNNLPLIRNSVLYAISTRDRADLIDPAKREGLMKDLRYNIDRSLQSGRVDAVLLNALNVY
ncbi:MAG: flagellar basal body-associated FliL family protein [Nitrospinae bacterium]|nr:flagellar basal body-associated FliL family protein [Nitrospinota bacterium]